MAREKKSYDLHVELPSGITSDEMMKLVERASEATRPVYLTYWELFEKEISQLGSLALQKERKGNRPDRRHFLGCESLLWLMIRNREPALRAQNCTSTSASFGNWVAKLKPA